MTRRALKYLNGNFKILSLEGKGGVMKFSWEQDVLVVSNLPAVFYIHLYHRISQNGTT